VENTANKIGEKKSGFRVRCAMIGRKKEVLEKRTEIKQKEKVNRPERKKMKPKS
jgi:hypothetical protein